MSRLSCTLARAAQIIRVLIGIRIRMLQAATLHKYNFAMTDHAESHPLPEQTSQRDRPGSTGSRSETPPRVSHGKFGLLILLISVVCFLLGVLLSPGPDFTHRWPFGVSMAAAMLLSVSALKQIQQGRWKWFLKR